jgi:hypothetical protein
VAGDVVGAVGEFFIGFVHYGEKGCTE